MSLKTFIHNKLNTYSKSQKTYSNVDFDILNKVSEELKSKGLDTRVNKFGSIFCELNGRDVALRYDSENKKWLKLLPHVDSNPNDYKVITDIIDEVISKYSDKSQKTYSVTTDLYNAALDYIDKSKMLIPSDVAKYLMSQFNASRSDAYEVAYGVCNNYSKSPRTYSLAEEVGNILMDEYDISREWYEKLLLPKGPNNKSELDELIEYGYKNATPAQLAKMLWDRNPDAYSKSPKTYSSMSTLEKCKAKLISEFNKLNVSDEDRADMKASIDAMNEDQFIESCRTELSQIDDSDSMVPILKECLNDLGKDGLHTYSWAWLIKAIGVPVVMGLINAVFRKVQFKDEKKKKLFEAEVEKFRNSRDPEETEKIRQRLMRQLGEADNADEVKKAAKEFEDKMKKEHPESK